VNAPTASTPRTSTAPNGLRSHRRPPTSNPSPVHSSVPLTSIAASARQRVESWIISPTVGSGQQPTSTPAFRRCESVDSAASANGPGTSARPVPKPRSSGSGSNSNSGGSGGQTKTKNGTNVNEVGTVGCIPRNWSTPFDLGTYLDDELAPSRRGVPGNTQLTPTNGSSKGRGIKRTPSDSGLVGLAPPTTTKVTTPSSARTPVTGSLVPSVRQRRHGGHKESNGQQATGTVTGRAVLRVQQPQQVLLQDGALIADTRHNATYRKGHLLGKVRIK